MDKPALRSKILPPTCRGSSEALFTLFHLTGSASRAGSILRIGKIAFEDSGLNYAAGLDAWSMDAFDKDTFDVRAFARSGDEYDRGIFIEGSYRV